MKTILYNPIFINPQAYYVFPNLNGLLVELKDATIEPAKYSGIIEVKIIANGDIHKIKQFKNTDNIDFTEFSESWVRINQYTLEGNIVLGEWKIGNIEGKPSLDPSIKQALVGVWIADGKSNTDPDHNIIKNKLLGRGGDFEILNAEYEGMSGCNGYPVVFGTNKTWEHLSGTANYTSDTTNTTIHITHVRLANRGLLYSYVKENGVLTNIKEIPSFRVTVKGLEGNSKLVYKYLATKDATKETSLHLSNGIHKLPKSFVPTDALLDLTTNVWIGMSISPISEEVTEFDCDISIKVLPEYEGSFVTDGVDDMIVSQKSVFDMLGGSSELTVVTMMYNLTDGVFTYNNYIRPYTKGYIRTRFGTTSSNKLCIGGYTIVNINQDAPVSKDNVDAVYISGSRTDFIKDASATGKLDGRFSVEGRMLNDDSIGECSQVAWYWTFIANRVLTTDEINQVMTYYNLDKYIESAE
ncbi:hypothetical protein [uncultured phage cr56_1]|uniref:Uncharacterized protein n=1 Tax=uncultured phage cr56_1 TaxID=2772081 RepID=A0A7M1RR68_9CAUD|nr:hypothetical protein KNV48_gp57 [uncultured phage cr56_1]QOR56863.1 hypothetical protein [uncultured phage cr56_1]